LLLKSFLKTLLVKSSLLFFKDSSCPMFSLSFSLG
jgi:hypothetical protein